VFTIIIPTHNRPALLQRTLRSLIAQTYRNFTVVIVDDSATYIPPYEELLLLKGQYVYIIRSGNEGPAESRNMGVSIAHSKYILFLDDDDTYASNHLEELARCIGDHSPALLFHDFQVCNETRTTSPPTQLSIECISISGVTRDSVYIRNRIPNSCLVYRRDVIAHLQHESNMVIYEDWDFLLKCLQDHDLTYAPLDSVIIHKSVADTPENMRRGNSHNEKIMETMMHLYRKHRAPNMDTRLARQALIASAGTSLALEHF
jgi:glycosyltransferase involved in cell wall biosynthesis